MSTSHRKPKILRRRFTHTSTDPRKQESLDSELMGAISTAKVIEIAPRSDEPDEDFVARAERNEKHNPVTTPCLHKPIDKKELEIVEIMMEREHENPESAQHVLVPECAYEKDGMFYILMRTGESNLFRDMEGGVIDGKIDDVLKMMMKALRFLDLCMIVHLDIKPENVIRCGGKYCLADFGKCAVRGTTVDPNGTQMYTAPEGFNKNGLSTLAKVVASFDYWSTGVMLWACAKKSPPWLHAHTSDEKFLLYKFARGDLASKEAAKNSGAKRKFDCICPLAEVHCPRVEVRRLLCLDEISSETGDFIFDALGLDSIKRAAAVSKRLCRENGSN